jgi:hypothetical protein
MNTRAGSTLDVRKHMVDIGGGKVVPCGSTNRFELLPPLRRRFHCGAQGREPGGPTRRSTNVRIVPQTPEQFESALRRYKQAADKSWSLTDCASFQVMEVEQIQAALTHDQHFAQAGFETLLR